MPGNSLNLVEMANGYITNEFKERLSSALGESRNKTQSGLDAAVPGLLSGLDSSASTSDGAQRFASAVDHADDGVLSNIGSIFGKGAGSNIGIGTLQSLLGMGGLSELTGNIGRFSGLPGKGVTSMLGFLAPVLFGMFKQLKQSRGLDAPGLLSLLAGQRSNIAAAMPEGMREHYQETYEPLRPVTDGRVTKTYSNVETRHHRSSLAWILPLAILAGLLGLLWRGASRSPVHAGRDDSGLAERTATERANAQRMASFESLTNKYQPVIDVAKAQGVNISNLSGQNGKMILQGSAPSLEAANKVWDAIKRVNPRMDDIIADIKVNSTQAEPLSSSSGYREPETDESNNTQQGNAAEGVLPRTKPGTSESSADTGTRTYVVKAGDTLSSISNQFYGNAKDYQRILEANRSQLQNPHLLKVGQKLEIPMK